ncbi:L-serine ammonia-lyase [Arhodomonas sp. AD133]|uniref:L-serine ammonia-lyase n=1 Tax=Arhodomonas sp. AD133 TaxID=3415009 RepID=UPI003EBC96D4
MAVSVFDLFKIGIGPSSSHTVGPMKAARQFLFRLSEADILTQAARVKAELYGSLALTGRGHGSDRAVMLGLEGEQPETVDTERVAERVERIRRDHRIHLLGRHPVRFHERRDLVMHKRGSLPHHPNGMRFTAYDAAGEVLRSGIFYSVGGGFVLDERAADAGGIVADTTEQPYPFSTAAELLAHCRSEGLNVSDIMFANERVWRGDEEIRDGLRRIWETMQACVEAGCRREGTLPGPLQVRRRAPAVFQRLTRRPEVSLQDPLSALDWVNLYALAVNEENASGERVVTAPTNGAAGIIPAVLHYYDRFVPGASEDGVIRFLLTAGAIGLLYKERASISGAEVGCQGEVGVACSMAAGALAEVRGGTPAQVENAAEIGMEHNLGLTCDPVGGLVQVPCIERNAMGAIKAVNAVRMALVGDGTHCVSLDKVIKTMRDTGADMKTKYKETARGGLAVNVIEC